MEHDGERAALALDISAPDSAGRVTLKLSIPAVYIDHVALGRVPCTVGADSLRAGPFRFAFDPDRRTLHGAMPAGFVPVYAMPVTLERAERFDMPARPAPDAPRAVPVWSAELGSPIWAGATVAGRTVFVGAASGRLAAFDAATGAPRWTAQLGGAIRTRPCVHGDALFVQADDGALYRLDAATGRARWRVAIVNHVITRLPFDDPKSRFDRFGSDVTFAGGRLYVGTHDGKLLALDAATGKTVWEFVAGDAVLAAPAVERGRVYFGSYDHFVYALDARDGRLLWKRDTQGAVVSTPALDGDRLVIGNRAYDLLALSTHDGAVLWKRYVWMSWVESSVVIRDATAYLGSSDADAVFAFDVRSGRRLWSRDIGGWAWGQPAVGGDRVYLGSSGQVGYPAKQSASFFALDRDTGKPVWSFTTATPDSGSYGFAGSAALSGSLVYAAGLDGRLYAFKR